ncbi:GTPase-activating protein GYP2 [Pelomyxa schiedti]|nr:GTPase-activating protein GYP2 [Pelomyxa schiedti]
MRSMQPEKLHAALHAATAASPAASSAAATAVTLVTTLSPLSVFSGTHYDKAESDEVTAARLTKTYEILLRLGNCKWPERLPSSIGAEQVEVWNEAEQRRKRVAMFSATTLSNATAIVSSKVNWLLHSNENGDSRTSPSPVQQRVWFPKTPEQIWDQIYEKWKGDFSQLERTRELCNAIKKFGIPSDLRGPIWMHLTTATKHQESNPGHYSSMCSIYGFQTSLATSQVEKDIERTFVSSAALQTEEAKKLLRRVLNAYSWHNPEVGYCQAMNFIAAALILHLDDEDSFWLLESIVKDILPRDYYKEKLDGVLIDMWVLNILAEHHFPKLMQHLSQISVVLDVFLARWFLSLFVGVFPLETAIRALDVIFLEGDAVMFSIALGLLKFKENELLKADTSSAMIILRDIPNDVSPNTMCQAIGCVPLIKPNKLDALRKEGRQILAEQRSLLPPIGSASARPIQTPPTSTQNGTATATSTASASATAIPTSTSTVSDSASATAIPTSTTTTTTPPAMPTSTTPPLAPTTPSTTTPVPTASISIPIPAPAPKTSDQNSVCTEDVLNLAQSSLSENVTNSIQTPVTVSASVTRHLLAEPQVYELDGALWCGPHLSVRPGSRASVSLRSIQDFLSYDPIQIMTDCQNSGFTPRSASGSLRTIPDLYDNTDSPVPPQATPAPSSTPNLL